MNHKPILSLLAILLLSSMVFAQSEEFEQGTDYNGAPSWDYYKEQLSIVDKVLVSNKGLIAVVNGATCSSSADWSNPPDKSYVTTSKICWANKNGGSPSGQGTEHRGVAFQVFLTENGKTERIKEISIFPNTDGCVDVTPNHYYYR